MPVARARLSRVPGRGTPPHVRQKFLVSGTLDGHDAHSVSLVLKNQAGTTVTFDPPVLTTYRSRDAGGQRFIRWTAKVSMTNAGNNLPMSDYTLTAYPLRRDSMPHDAGRSAVRPLHWDGGCLLKVALVSTGIDYPPNNHPIQGDELDFLYCTGESDVPVWNASLTEQGTTNSRTANYVYWVSELSYWVAEFLNLRTDPGTGTGNWVLTLDVQGSPSTIVIL